MSGIRRTPLRGALAVFVLALGLRVALLPGEGAGPTAAETRVLDRGLAIWADGARPADYADGVLAPYLVAGSLGALALVSGDPAPEPAALVETARRDPAAALFPARLVAALLGAFAAAWMVGAAGWWSRAPGPRTTRGLDALLEPLERREPVGPWIAGVAIAVHPGLVAAGATAVPLALALPFAVLWFRFAGRYQAGGGTLSLAAAGGAFGALVAALPAAALLLPLQILLPVIGHRRRSRRGWIAALLAPPAVFLALAPFAVLDVSLVAPEWGAGLRGPAAPVLDLVLPSGMETGLGPVLAVLALAGVFVALVRRGTAGWWLVVAAELLLLAAGTDPRLALPGLLLLVGLGSDAVLRPALRRAGSAPPPLVTATALLVVLPQLVLSLRLLLR